jgi:hypothetical protein
VDLAAFTASLEDDNPPRGVSAAVAGLWWDAKGDWTKAHEAAQRQEDAAGAWVHAYLHRKEGDLENARYWYRRAGKTESTAPLAREWEEIAAALLDRQE